MLCKFEPISLENDLALLELSSAVALQENIIPVCLHTEETDSLGTNIITKILPQSIYYSRGSGMDHWLGSHSPRYEPPCNVLSPVTCDHVRRLPGPRPPPAGGANNEQQEV